MPSQKKSNKEEKKSLIQRKYSLPPKSRALILLDISDQSVSDWLLEALETIHIATHMMTDSIEELDELSGYDAVISDLSSKRLDIIQAVQSGVVPIIPIDNDFASNLSEFDPMKFTGNAFLYEKVNPYHIFEKVIRYLENVRYAGDKRTLMQNLEKTF